MISAKIRKGTASAVPQAAQNQCGFSRRGYGIFVHTNFPQAL